MMKSWADHCSSDEDTDDNYSVDSEEPNEGQSFEAAFAEKVQVSDHNKEPNAGETEQQVRNYNFPERPPFTAFVGNISYDIQESSQLQQALADLVFERLGERVNVLGGRISYDRDSKNKKHRGFGYVELETLEELKTVMRLNDEGQAILAGRKIQLDTANNQNRANNNYNQRGQGSHHHNNHRGSFNRRNIARPQNNEPVEKIDGSKFRGGKYNKNDNSSNDNNNRNNSFRNNSFQNGPTSGDAPRQRPSLKLAPRSKPVDGGDRFMSSNIFGDAKARDEQTWKKSRQQQQQQDQQASGGDEKRKQGGEDDNSGNSKNAGKDNKLEHQDRRQSGRGGGRGGKGRGNHHRGSNNNGGRGEQNNQNHKRGSGRRNSHQQNDKKHDKRQHQPSPEEKTDPVPKTNNKHTDTTSSNPEPKAPKNKFALLMDDSDSD